MARLRPATPYPRAAPCVAWPYRVEASAVGSDPNRVPYCANADRRRTSAAPRRGEPRPALIRRSECLGGLAMPRTSSSAKPWPKPSPGASDRPTPASFQPRAAVERLFRRVPPPPPRSLCLSRTIHRGRTRLDRVPVRSNPPDLDPTDQIRRYRFACPFCIRAPSFCYYQPAILYSVKTFTLRPRF